MARRPKLRADNGNVPARKGGENLIPLADPRLVARVKRSSTNRDVAIRVEEAETGRVVKDLGSRKYRGTADVHMALAAATPRRGPRGSGRLFFGGMGWGKSKRLHGV